MAFYSVLLRMGFTGAPPVTGRAVVSYTAFPPLPGDPGGLFLLHWPWSHLHRTLSGILPYGARTFLTCTLTVQPRSFVLLGFLFCIIYIILSLVMEKQHIFSIIYIKKVVRRELLCEKKMNYFEYNILENEIHFRYNKYTKGKHPLQSGCSRGCLITSQREAPPLCADRRGIIFYSFRSS